jgi:serine/threonine-protein kinase
VALGVGTRLGPHEILSAIGAGGMGEVYRAKDTKLGRDVALKILPSSFTNDPDRVARFRREAQVLASLNHPHIAQIYGLEEANGTQFLVLELVDGESLDKRIARGKIPVDEALGIAKQIAEALEVAHEKGIIHRDLKPANIALTKDGQVKVLDFGLAKAVESTSGSVDAMNSPTITSPAMMTGVGVILGTAAYMSPEQSKGRPADKRSDVWAFGCVLYELLTGRRAFGGDDVGDTLATVLKSEPEWKLVPAEVPIPIRALVEGCLKKDRVRRVGDLSTALFLLTESSALNQTARSKPWPLHTQLVWIGTAMLIVVVLFLWAVRRGPSIGSRSVVRLSMGLQPAASLLSSPDTVAEGRPTRTAFVWSPDGRTVVFGGARAGVQQLFTRHLDQLEGQPLSGTEGAVAPFFSPDGRWVGFWAHGELKKVSITGGPAVTITKSELIYRAVWGEGDTIFFDQLEAGVGIPESIWRVNASGGRAEVVASPDRTKPEYSYRLPHLLPGGKALLFTVTRAVNVLEDAQIVVRSLDTGRQQVVTAGADARYVPPGYLVFMRLGTLLAAPFDATRTALTGGAVGLIDGVMQSVHAPTRQLEAGAGQFSISSDGSLAYVPGGTFTEDLRSLVWVDRSGVVTPIAAPLRQYWAPRLTSDGQRLAVYSRGPEGRIWIHDFRTGITTPLTDPGGTSVFPVWSPDNTRVIFASGSPLNLSGRVADGSRPSERLTTSPANQTPSSFSPDGQYLAFVQSDQAGDHIWTLTVHDGHASTSSWRTTPFHENYPTWSPDGQWLAFSSDESGRNELFIQPFPGPGPRYPVSRDGGISPVWSHDGREIFYAVRTGPLAGGQFMVMAAPVTVSPSVSIGAPKKLFEGAFWVSSSGRGFDVAPDGHRFLMVRPEEHRSTPATEMVIVENWIEELKARMPSK